MTGTTHSPTHDQFNSMYINNNINTDSGSNLVVGGLDDGVNVGTLRTLSEKPKSWLLRVYMLNCEYRTFVVTQDTTAEDVCKLLGGKMEFMNANSAHLYFRLFLSSDFGCNFYHRLTHNKPIVKEIKRNSMGRKEEHIMVVYKIHLFMDKEIMMSKDETIQNFLYYQAVHDLLTGYYPCNVEEAIWIAALNAQYRYGDFDEKKNCVGFYSSFCELKDLLPFWLVARREGETPSRRQARLYTLETAIIEAHKKMASLPHADACNHVMENCRRYTFYGNVFFLVGIEPATKKMLNLGNSKKTIIVGVSIVGLKLFEKSSKSCLRRFLFRNLSTWGFTQSGDFFVDAKFRPGGGSPRKSGTDDTPKRMVFKTDQGKVIADLLNEYAKAIVLSGRYESTSSVGSAAVIEGSKKKDMATMAEQKVQGDKEKEDISTKSTTDETGIMPSVVMSILRVQGMFRGHMLRRRVRENAAALLIQSAWRGYRARMALHNMIDHMTSLLISNGVDVLKAVSEIDEDKKAIAREDMV
jgi:hypothetical protein